jgi:hypothetical protein
MSVLNVLLIVVVLAAAGLVGLRAAGRGRRLRPWRAGPGPEDARPPTAQAGAGDGSGAVAYGGREPAWPAVRPDGQEMPAAGQRLHTEAVPLGLAGRELAVRESETARPVPAAVADRPLGLAVTAVSVPAAGVPQDAYYVQGNVVALARSLRPAGIDQRAAALALSAVMSSRLGRADDARAALQEGVSAANRLVRSVSGREPGYSDMVTTLDVVYLEASGPSVLLAHVGNSAAWLQRAAGRTVERLSEVHSIGDGPLLRAIGLSPDVVADITEVPVRPGDRIFLTTSGPAFSFSPEMVASAVAAMAEDPLADCAAALASLAHSPGGPAGVTVVAAEIARGAMFWGEAVPGR